MPRPDQQATPPAKQHTPTSYAAARFLGSIEEAASDARELVTELELAGQDTTTAKTIADELTKHEESATKHLSKLVN